MRQDRAYLSIMSWPPAFDQTKREDALATLPSIDRYKAKELSRRSVPAMCARLTLAAADEIVRQLRAWGVDAIAVPGDELVPRLNPPMVKAITCVDPMLEDLTAELWHGPPTELHATQIVALVRGHARTPKAGSGGDLAVQMHQLQGTWQAQDWNQGPTRRARLEVVEVLDIHMKNEQQLRILGGKYSCECLGQEKAKTIRENVDAMTGRLSEVAKINADRGFEHAMFLAEFARDFADGSNWRDLTGFSIYSAWLGYVAARTSNR